MPVMTLFFAACLIALAPAALAQPVTVASSAPVVVATTPPAGDVKVDPGLKQISVTFSKSMLTESMWSWVKASDGSFPQITGPVSFLEDGRTCVAPVKLEPAKGYAIWFNHGRYNAFKDRQGRPATPYLLVFETKK